MPDFSKLWAEAVGELAAERAIATQLGLRYAVLEAEHKALEQTIKDILIYLGEGTCPACGCEGCQVDHEEARIAAREALAALE